MTGSSKLSILYTACPHISGDAPTVFKVPAHSPNNPNNYIQYIRALNDYFWTVPIKHFDGREELVFFCDLYPLSHFFIASLGIL